MLNKMAQSCGLELAVEYQKHKMMLGFKYVSVVNGLNYSPEAIQQLSLRS